MDPLFLPPTLRPKLRPLAVRLKRILVPPRAVVRPREPLLAADDGRSCADFFVLADVPWEVCGRAEYCHAVDMVSERCYSPVFDSGSHGALRVAQVRGILKKSSRGEAMTRQIAPQLSQRRRVCCTGAPAEKPQHEILSNQILERKPGG